MCSIVIKICFSPFSENDSESNSNAADRVSDQLQSSSITDVTGPSGNRYL